MIVVSNTTPLIGLASIERFGLLQDLFGEIVISQAVYDESVIAGHDEDGARREVEAAVWIRTVEIQDRLAVDVFWMNLIWARRKPLCLPENLERTGY